MALCKQYLNLPATGLEFGTLKECLGSYSRNSLVISEDNAFQIGSCRSFHSEVESTMIVLWICPATCAFRASRPKLLVKLLKVFSEVLKP
ncbi:UNVERIFIED_CONTAM: hypothetical protein Sradi_6443600 [Sesamum radiatum]|uniref:Uncharacterized protein n=1 Tax=Sesamum radiatum TaxID=300843 RepID=A0AAW2K5J7_SESRA